MLRHRKIAKQFIVGITIFTMFLLIGACNRTSTTTVGKQSAVVTEVSLSGVAAGSSIEVGTSRTLSATVKGTDIDSDSNGVNWTVSGGATIVPAGNTVTVTGTSAGDAVVTAKSTEDSSKSKSITLKIVAKPEPPAPAPVTTGGLDISVSPAGAKVVVKNKATNAVVSDANGSTLLSDLAAGTYSIVASNSGFESSTVEVNVVAATTKSLNISLNKVSGPVVVTPKVTGMSASPSSVTLVPGEMVTIVSTVFGEGAYSDSTAFSSGDSSIATVDAAGKVTAVAKGIAIITAASKGTPNIKATTTVNVVDAPATTGGLDISVTPASAAVTVKDNAGATIDTFTGAKVISGLAAGTYVVEASAPGFDNGVSRINVVVGQTKAVSLTLSATPVAAVTAVSVAPAAATLTIGQTLTLAANATGTGAFDGAVTFESADTSIATVDANGKVTAVAQGTAVIIAKSTSNPGVVGSSQITVAAAAPTKGALEISVTPSSAAVVVKDSSGADIGSFTGSKVLADLVPGTYTISATATGFTADSVQAIVVVGQTKAVNLNLGAIAVTSINVTPATLNLTKGATTTLVATVQGTGAFDNGVTYVSGDTSIATVDANGKVTAVSAGTTTVTVTSVGNSNVSTAVQVVVTALAAPAPAIQFPFVGTQLNGPASGVSLQISETTNLAKTELWVQPAANANVAFSEASATKVDERVFVNASALSTQAIDYNLAWNTSILNDGSNGSLATNASRSAPEFMNGSYLIIVQTISITGEKIHDKVFVTLDNDDVFQNGAIRFNRANQPVKDINGANWYGNGDVDVIFQPRLFDPNVDVARCTSTAGQLARIALTPNIQTDLDIPLVNSTFDDSFNRANTNNLIETNLTVNCMAGDANGGQGLNLDNVAPSSASVLYSRAGAAAIQPLSAWVGSKDVYSLNIIDGGVGDGGDWDQFTNSTINAVSRDQTTAAEFVAHTDIHTTNDMQEQPNGFDYYLRPNVVSDRLGNTMPTSSGNRVASNFVRVDLTNPEIINLYNFDNGDQLNGSTQRISTQGVGGLTSPYQAVSSDVPNTTSSNLSGINSASHKWSVAVDGVTCAAGSGSVSNVFNPNGGFLASSACYAGVNGNTGNIKESLDIVVTVSVEDNAGNCSDDFSASYRYDVTAPTVALTPDSDINAETGTQVTWNVSYMDNLAGANTVLTAFTPAYQVVVSEVAAAANDSTQILPHTFTAWHDGSIPANNSGIRYDLEAIDAVGNTTFFRTITHEFEPGLSDFAVPSVSQPNIRPNAVFLGNSVTIEMAQVTDNGSNNVLPSGIAEVKVYVYDNVRLVYVPIGTATKGSGNQYSLTYTPSSIGTFTFIAVAVDSNGNVESSVTSSNLVVSAP